MSEFEAIRLDVRDHKAFVTLDRPEAANSFDEAMQRELHEVWNLAKADPEIRVVVVTGAGDRAFCTGIDRYVDKPLTFEREHWQREDPSQFLSPKTCRLWKPVIGAVNGMACGGAFYILGECDIVIAAEHATFFDPHVTFGMTACFESMHMLQKMPFHEIMRLALLGSRERMSAERAYAIGLVSEVVPAEELASAAAWAADAIAQAPPTAVQGTVRALWAARDLGRKDALDMGKILIRVGSDPADLLAGQQAFQSGQRIEPRIR